MVLFGAAISSEAFVIILVFFRVSENDEFIRGFVPDFDSAENESASYW